MQANIKGACIEQLVDAEDKECFRDTFVTIKHSKYNIINYDKVIN